MLTRLLLCAALAVLAVSAQAATYVVAMDGNDAAAGTAARPWRTLQRAVDAVAPGDTVLVRAGTYAGCRLERSGRAGAPCTLRAESGAHVLLDRPGPANRHRSLLEVERFNATVGYWIIDGFEVSHSPAYGIDVRGTEYITIRHCVVHDSAITGIVTAFSPHVTIEYNECYRNHEHGIYHANSADYPILRGNLIHNNDTCGIHMNGDATMGHGDGQISHARVEDNIIWENGTPRGGSAINCDGVSDSIFRNNLCVNNHASGISLYAGDGAEGSSRNLVVNNTILMAPGARWAVNIPASTGGRSNPVDNVIENNILYTPDSQRGSILVYDPVASRLRSDHNAVVARFSADGDHSLLSLQAWRARGLDEHSVLITPDLVPGSEANVTTGGYRPRPGCALIGAGVARPEVTHDLAGALRPAKPSLGCYEPERKRSGER